MNIDGIWSGLFAAIVIGALGRLLVRGYQPLGCLLTLLVGLVGAAIGGAIGKAQHFGFWTTFATQAVISALLVLVFSLGTRNRQW
ncbi:MAG TPA: GlsB/YeaQ/YmgE family stress response membrane protein [Actinomycetes bacterium]